MTVELGVGMISPCVVACTIIVVLALYGCLACALACRARREKMQIGDWRAAGLGK
jgi:hypothetical protein